MSQPGGATQTLLNPMQSPRIGKVVVNISVGKSGEPLQKAVRILEQLTGQKPSTRKAKKTIRDWGVSRKESIACLVTLRGERATNFLKRAFDAIGRKLTASHFDRNGNFSYGIREHIDIPGTRYDPELGIVGMDVCVSMEKAGYDVKRRRRAPSPVGRRQRLTPEESMAYVREAFGVEILEAEESG